MSFQNKGFWMAGSSGFPDSDAPYDSSSKNEHRHPNQWFLDPSETEFFPNKKSAVEGSNGRPISGVPNVNLPWEAPFGFQGIQSVAGQYTDQLFGPEPSRTIDFGGRNFQSMNAANLDIGRRGIEIENHHGNDASIALSMSPTLDDAGSCLTYGGIRKVKVNQVKDSNSSMSRQMVSHYSSSDRSSASFIGYQEAPETTPQLCRLNQTTDFSNATPIQMGKSFSRYGSNTISFNGFQDEHETNQVKDHESFISMQLGNTYSKGDNSTISFGDYPVEPEMTNYNLLKPPSVPQLEVLKDKSAPKATNTDLVVSATPVSAVSNGTAKSKNEPKEPKKVPPNTFPSNVRSLLNTGILDGVPVKYISWQREELEGVIKGCGYMCGCNSCKYSKALNAYEFEKHAGTKTKHPNNHIYFENGKTVYAIVQELKSTPQKMLFEAIQNCTGSPVNQKAFKTWKESYQAATRELERIYGKDLLKLSTSSED